MLTTSFIYSFIFKINPWLDICIIKINEIFFKIKFMRFSISLKYFLTLKMPLKEVN